MSMRIQLKAVSAATRTSARAARRSIFLPVCLLGALVFAACGRSDTPPARQGPDIGPRPANAAATSSATASGSVAPSTPAAPKRPIVLFIGTSLTAGYGLADPTTEAYPAQVARLADSAGTPIDAVNAGVSGETSSGARQRLAWLLKQPADVVWLETGANDGLRGLSVSALRSNLTAIIEQIQKAKPGVPIFLAQMEAPPNMGSTYVTSFRAVYGEVAKATGVTLTPFLLDRVAGVTRLNQGDGLHPSAEGAKVVAGGVWKALQPVILKGYSQIRTHED